MRAGKETQDPKTQHDILGLNNEIARSTHNNNNNYRQISLMSIIIKIVIIIIMGDEISNHKYYLIMVRLQVK